MQALHMLTVVTDGKVKPYAGTLRSTTRKFDGKYMGLMCGDHIVMHHTKDPQTQGAALLTELLTVSALSIGNLEELLSSDISREQILAFYPLEEGKERNPEELFINIYF
jgi:hypothetical protein